MIFIFLINSFCLFVSIQTRDGAHQGREGTPTARIKNIRIQPAACRNQGRRPPAPPPQSGNAEQLPQGEEKKTVA